MRTASTLVDARNLPLSEQRGLRQPLLNSPSPYFLCNMVKPSVFLTITHLLEMTERRGCSKEEARVARAKALALMDLHGITLKDLAQCSCPPPPSRPPTPTSTPPPPRPHRAPPPSPPFYTYTERPQYVMGWFGWTVLFFFLWVLLGAPHPHLHFPP
jgi:Protein of unknown function (DUF2786)